jgi:hypothetical protein
MTKSEILDLIATLRDLAIKLSDGGNQALAAELRAFAAETEADLRSGALPFSAGAVSGA